MPNTFNVEISTKTILQTVGLLLGLYVCLLIADIILLVFIAILLTAAINPIVSKINDAGIPKGAAIGIVYLGGILLCGLIAMLILPTLTDQVVSLYSQINLPKNIAKVMVDKILVDIDMEQFISQIRSVPGILSPISSVFTFFVHLTTLAVMTFYLLIERHNLHKHLHIIIRNRHKESHTKQILDNVEKELGSWTRGAMALMFIIGLLTYIGLTLLGMPYALPLAIAAGMLEILPNLGPTLSAIPALFIAMSVGSTPLTLGVLALYIAIQQLENNFITPFIMRQSVGLNPIITIIILLIGHRLGGLMGAILGIPIFIVLKAFYLEYRKTLKS